MMTTTTTLRRHEGGTKAAAIGTVPRARRASAASEGAAERADYMVDDHDPLDARHALAAANLMMSQIGKGVAA